MIISPKITAANREQLARTIIDKSYRRTFRAAGVLRQLCDSNLRDVLEENFELNRPANRRHAGTQRLANSFETVVEGPRDKYPINVRIQVRPRVASDPDAMAKIRSLLHGSRPHQIAPTKGFLRFPWIGYSGQTAVGSAKRTFEAFGRPNVRTSRPVDHPGTRPTEFLEEAARRSIAQLRRRV